MEGRGEEERETGVRKRNTRKVGRDCVMQSHPRVPERSSARSTKFKCLA